VLPADDHRRVREGLCALHRVEGDITVAAEARYDRAAVAFAKAHRPAIAVMSIAMPLLNGLEAPRKSSSPRRPSGPPRATAPASTAAARPVLMIPRQRTRQTVDHRSERASPTHGRVTPHS
jgi:DNA-binding NarL/FixJ family response regulator